MATTPIVFSSQRAAASAPVRCSRPGSIGTSRGSTCQYRQNFSQQTCTLAPMTRFGRRAGAPSAWLAWRARQRHSSAIPPSMHASLDPVVEQPVGPASVGPRRVPEVGPGCSRSAAPARRSAGTRPCRSCSCRGTRPSARAACGSIQVVTKVARLSRALPSRISSSRTTCSAVSGSMPWAGIRSAADPVRLRRTYSGLMSISAARPGSPARAVQWPCCCLLGDRGVLRSA